MDYKTTFAIFASGEGSNAENLFHYIQTKDNALVSCLITDNLNAQVICKAKKYNINVHIIEKSSNETKSEHEKKILDVLTPLRPDWILLAGYMKILSPSFIDHFFDPKLNNTRIINIHPSLLPHFKGSNAYQQAFDQGVSTSGVTLHFVDTGIDTGNIILQESFNRNSEDNFEQFKKRGLALEHQLYRRLVDNILTGELEKQWVL